jgi:hypothetical protein
MLLRGQIIGENCGSKTLKLRTSEKIAIAELRSCGCGATFPKQLRNCDCGSASCKLRNCDCGLKKQLRMPISVYKDTR